MRIVHTTYFLTTLVFLIIATFLLTEQPIPDMQQELLKQESQVNKTQTTQTQMDQKPEPYEAAQTQETLANLPKREVIATGYYAGIESTGKDKDHPQYGITYSGAKVVRGQYSTIAADLDVFPLGTILFIPGYGYGVVADIGSAIKGNKIDLYFDSMDDIYREWGKKTVDVYIVKQGEGTVTDAMMESLNGKKVVQANVPQAN